MSKNTVMNLPMRKIMDCKYPYVYGLLQKKQIIDEMAGFFKDVKMYEADGRKCFSVQNVFESTVYFQNNDLSIMEWEWDTNEIYLNKSLIKRQYKKVVMLCSEYIEKMLLQKFPTNSFIISFCVQFGKHRNINIRICQDLKDSVLDRNLELYNQPIMQIHLKT